MRAIKIWRKLFSRTVVGKNEFTNLSVIFFQLNPTKMDNPMDACANAEFLLKVLDDITQSIFASAAACPM